MKKTVDERAAAVLAKRQQQRATRELQALARKGQLADDVLVVQKTGTVQPMPAGSDRFK